MSSLLPIYSALPTCANFRPKKAAKCYFGKNPIYLNNLTLKKVFSSHIFIDPGQTPKAQKVKFFSPL